MSSLDVAASPVPEAFQKGVVAPDQKGRRFDQIDALRGLAALMVVLSHAVGFSNLQDKTTLFFLGQTYHPLYIFSYSYVGVDLFFVLSGFCLSWPFLAKCQKPFHVREYALKRIQRIYPAYFFCFMVLLLAGLICRHSHIAHLQEMAFAVRLTLPQILASLALQMTHLNPAFWTLCLEFRWYFLFPLALIFARKSSAWLLLPIALLSTLITPAVQTGVLSVLKVFAYLTAFVVGIIAAEVHARPDLPFHRFLRRWAFVGVLLFGAVCVQVIPTVTPTQRCGYHEVLPTAGLFFFLVLWAVEYQKRLPCLVNALRAVGVFSYSLYLVHLPLLELAQAVLRPDHWTPAMQILLWIVLAPATVTGLSYLFFLAAEKPFLSKPGRPVIPAWRWSLGVGR